jgi:hypothetical protein
MFDFFEGEEDLFPADGEVGAAFGHFRAWAGLLEDEPPDAEDDPVCARN